MSTHVSGPDAAGRWTVHATRSSGGATASAEATVNDRGSAESEVWQRLAGARAWLELGEKLLAEGRPADAADAADSGIEELGSSYRAELTKDDTKVKLLAAEEQRAAGALAQAVQATLRVLGERVAAFIRTHEEAAG